MRTSFASPGADAPRAVTTFEWLAGKTFLIQRWEVDQPDAPDGIAVIGWDDERGTLLQHYFDSRGVARVYEMTVVGRVWTLQRLVPGFCQRFTATFDDDGDAIRGRWEFSEDGTAWRRDFDLTYERVR